ncbi:MAG: succinate--CoA ligase subunit beta, partial [Bacteroidia bacterium]
MNLHEYQGKSILKSFNVDIQEGFIAETADRAIEIAGKLKDDFGSDFCVIKAQIHAGGRGKGGGVKLARSPLEAGEITGKILGMQLVTPQTGPEGKRVNKVLVAQDVYYPGDSETSEFYLSVLLDRGRGKFVIMYSPEGGMDIEEVAEKTPHLIFREEIDPGAGLRPFQARRIAFNLGLEGKAFKEMQRFAASVFRAFSESDAQLLEINPVLKTSDDRIIAVDCKMSIDDNALYRHPAIMEMRDLTEEDPAEVEAGKFNLNFIKLDGNVGCMVNG